MEVFQCTSQDMLTLQGLVSLPCSPFRALSHIFESLGWGMGMDIFWYHTVK